MEAGARVSEARLPVGLYEGGWTFRVLPCREALPPIRRTGRIRFEAKDDTVSDGWAEIDYTRPDGVPFTATFPATAMLLDGRVELYPEVRPRDMLRFRGIQGGSFGRWFPTVGANWIGGTINVGFEGEFEGADVPKRERMEVVFFGERVDDDG